MKRALFLPRSLRLFLFLTPFLSLSAQDRTAITAEELRGHLRVLAADSLEGRGAGSRGERIAAQYLTAEFRQAGLQPAGDDGTFEHAFTFIQGAEPGERNRIAVRSAGRERVLTIGTDARPLGFSGSGSFEGPVVFAGYGISFPDGRYDDYAGVDVSGKAVLLLREHPEQDNPHSEFIPLAGLRTKAIRARELGAKAVLIVAGVTDDEPAALIPFASSASGGSVGIPVLSITRTAAEEILALSGTGLSDRERGLAATRKPAPIEIEGVTLVVETDVRERRASSRNIVGFVPGTDPSLKDEVVVIGAHYDHLGWGGQGSGSLAPDSVAIHNGADDNASGTAGLIELAEYCAAHPARRGLLFAAFSGEERGLLGSAAFVERPTIPLSRMVAMVNMDMIGRLNNGKLIVYGAGTSPRFPDLLKRHTPEGLDVKQVPDGFGPSDQSSFYAKKIPVLHFFTDLHSDYHKPGDDWEKIQYEGMATVLGMVEAVVRDLADADAAPSYVSVEAPRRPAGGRGVRSYTGTIPDFGEQSGGMKLSGVTEGSPAAVAGLQAGDVIVRFGTIDIGNLYDYTFALGEYKPGDVVTVVVRRGTEELSFQLTVGSRK